MKKIEELLKLKKELTGYPSIDRTHEKNWSFSDKHPMIPGVSVYNAVNLMTKDFNDKYAVDCLDLRVTYKQMKEDAVIISKAMKEMGVKQGDIVTVAMANYYQALPIFLAANRIGATVTFLNAHAQSDEIKQYLNLFESPLFFNFDKSMEYNKDIKSDTKVENIITLHKEELNSREQQSSNGMVGYSNYLSYSQLGCVASHYKSLFSNNLNPNNDALILFTSGTTGNPKSVVLTNKNVLAAEIYAKNTSHTENITGPKTLICVPFAYPYGFVTSALTTLLWGKEAVLAPDIGKDTISYYYAKEPNIIFGSPALLELTMNNIPKNQDLSFVTHFISGGDFLTPSHAERGVNFFRNHGAEVEVGNGSGNAETVSSGTTPVGVPIRPETAGKILVGSDVIVVDPDTMEEKKYGEEGLLCVSGKHVFKGYYKEPQLTVESKFKRNGKEYFKTGTLGFLEEDGYFTITSRQSRFYIMSSLNKVYCDHIQNFISRFPCVRDCAIVKVPDEENLYVNKAYIVLNEEYEKSEAMVGYLHQLFHTSVEGVNGKKIQLKDYEIPTYIELVDFLPRKEGTEKIDYQTLEEDALKEVSAKRISLS